MQWAPRATVLVLAVAAGTRGALASKAAVVSQANAIRYRRSLRSAPRRQPLSLRQEDKVEALEAAEREALTAQQVALEALTAQKGALAAQNEVLQARQTQLTAQLASGIRNKEPPPFAAMGKEKLVEKSIGAAVYLFFVCISALIYTSVHSFSEPAPPKKMPPENKQDFQFGLFAGLACDPDPRICFFSCCCSPIRWADTVSDFKVHFLDFWPALLLFSLLQVAGSFSFGLSGLVLLLLVVQTRQRMRASYDLPYGTCGTTCMDCAVWAFCAPCATMQEALQVEYVEPPVPESMHGSYQNFK